MRVDLFTSSKLDLALGRANVIHAALKHGAASLSVSGRIVCAAIAAAKRRQRPEEKRGGVNADEAGTFWQAHQLAGVVVRELA